MLSERERQVLGEIERSVSASDPGLATLLSAGRRPRISNWSRAWHDAVLVLSVLSAMLCIVVGAVGAGVVATLFAAAVLFVRRMRFPSRRARRARPRTR